MTVQNLCSEAAERSGKSADFCTETTSIHGRYTRWLASAFVLVLLAGLFFFSLRLAGTRIFQIDEFVEVYVARVLSSGAGSSTALGNFGLFEIPLAWLVSNASRSIDALMSARLMMVQLFWVNILLMALATGVRLLSIQGLIALLGAATLAPLWDYGFEIRHDNPLLTGLLLMWCVARVSPGGVKSFVFLGALTLALQVLAFKAFVYTLPISLLGLVVFHEPHRGPRWKLLVAWVVGALFAFAGIRLFFGATGLWQNFLQGFSTTSAASVDVGYRFAPTWTLGRLLTQTPLLLALSLAALISSAAEVARRRRLVFDLAGNLPEILLVLIAFAALLINPNPFPYNLLHLVPYAYILVARYAFDLSKRITWPNAAIAPVAGALIFTHLVPFWVATRRHIDWPNWRQELLIRHAEDLTGPKDPVYDATGMVITRPIVDPRAFIYRANIKALVNGPGPHVRDMLAANPPAVYIPSYRTDALSEEDHEFVRQRYVSMADDFWVLGKVLATGGGIFEVIHAGRYRISSLAGSDLLGTFPNDVRAVIIPEEKGQLAISVDGHTLNGQVIELSVGTHRIETDLGEQAAVVWVGPRLDRIHRLPNSDHRSLLVNWY